MASKDSIDNVLSETRDLSKRMRAAYDDPPAKENISLPTIVSQPSCTIGDTAVSLEALRKNLHSLIEQAKIRIHKSSANQTAPMTERQAKLLNDAVYAASAVLRKQEQLTAEQKRQQQQGQGQGQVLQGEDFQDQMLGLNKKLNAVSIEMAKLKRASDNIMNIYANYQLENEEECDSDEEDTDSSAANDTIYRLA